MSASYHFQNGPLYSPFPRHTCDACRKSIRMTLFICLDCSAGRYLHTLDICSNCVDKAFTVTREKGTVTLNHLPTHLILQIRHPLPFLLQLPVWERAQFTFQEASPNSDAEESAGVCCKYCRNQVKRPYWACCDCLSESLNQY